MEKNNPQWILIHGTDYQKSKMADQFSACNGWHKDRAFPLSSLGYHVGYHKMVTGERLYTARVDEEVGAHCNQHWNGKSLNYQSLGICVGFDGDVEQMNAMEYAILQKQVWAWQDQYKIPNERVQFHRYFATEKTCPGSLFGTTWLKTLLTRPIVVNVPQKAPENMCMAQEKVIADQARKLRWYEIAFPWVKW